MSDYKIGDVVKWFDDDYEVRGVDVDGDLWIEDSEGQAWNVTLGSVELVSAAPVGPVDDVRPLVDALVSNGYQAGVGTVKAVLTLLSGDRGELTRGELLQAAAMLLVAAGMRPGGEPSSD